MSYEGEIILLFVTITLFVYQGVRCSPTTLVCESIVHSMLRTILKSSLSNIHIQRMITTWKVKRTD